MTIEVIHVKSDHEGQIRVTLAEPHGIVQAHRKVVARVPGLVYDHAGRRVTTVHGQSVEIPYVPGDTVDGLEILLAGQTQFLVPPGTQSLEFDDGTTFTLPNVTQEV